MSKSNLKNINNLTTTKNPYILYTNSTYSNLLYKLQKSCAWSLKTNLWWNQSLTKSNENMNFLAIMDFDKIWVTYMLVKDTTVKYNPNPMVSINTTIEVTSVANYNYVDIDLLAHFDQLAKVQRRRQRKLKEQQEIYKTV